MIRETHKGLNQPLAVSMAVSTFGICQFATLEYSEARQTLKTIGSFEQEYGIACVTGARGVSLAWDQAPHITFIYTW